MADGTIVGAVAGGSALAFFNRDGAIVGGWPTGLVEAHGITPAHDAIWVADIGLAAVPDGTGRYVRHEVPGGGRVVCFDLDGHQVGELPTPCSSEAEGPTYRPTSVALGPDRAIWVADGYGRQVVHRFSAGGRLELTLTGEEGVGRFECPHGIFIDERRPEPRLYIADRGNARLQVFALDGSFLDVVDEGLVSPTAFAVVDERLIVAELHARVAVLDGDDRVVGYIGEDQKAPERPGWPNAIDEQGLTIRPMLRTDAFNSPHGLAADGDGNLYIAEWLIGGRIVRLRAR